MGSPAVRPHLSPIAMVYRTLSARVPGAASASLGAAAALVLVVSSSLAFAQDAATDIDELETGDTETMAVDLDEPVVAEGAEEAPGSDGIPVESGRPIAPFAAGARAPAARGLAAFASASASSADPSGHDRILSQFPVSESQQYTQMTPVATRDGAVYLITLEPGPNGDARGEATLKHVLRRGTPDDPADPAGPWSWTATVIEDRGYFDTWHSAGSVGIDAAGHVHVAYNMHNFPWQHSRSRVPGSIAGGFDFRGQPITTAEILRHVVENKTTFPDLGSGDIPGNQISYPAFETSPAGDLYASYRFAIRPKRGFPDRTYATGVARHDADTGAWRSIGGALSHTPGVDFDGPAQPALRAVASEQGWTSYQPRISFGAGDDELAVSVMWRAGTAGDTVTAPCTFRTIDGGATFTTLDGTPASVPVRPGDCPNVTSARASDSYYSQGDVAADSQGRPHLMLSPVGRLRELLRWNGTEWTRVGEAPPLAVEIFFDADDNLWALTQGLEVHVRRAGQDVFETVYTSAERLDCLPHAALDTEARTAFVFAYGCDGNTTGTVLRLDLARLLGEPSPAAPTADALVLTRDEWHQVSIPFTRDAMTPAALFGAALGAADYFRTWILYRFEPAAGTYAAVGVNERLEPGRGYWIIQTPVDEATIPVPADARELSPFRPEACAAPACHRVPGAADAWTLGGIPSLRAAPLSLARVRTDAGACAGGCTLADADAAGVHSPALYAWDPAAGSYAALADGDSLTPWTGYWSRAVGGSADLLLPGGTP